MSVLRTIEAKIEGLFEGVFGRAFRTSVQPIELARKLVKEMEENRSVSVSRVYVPNEYAIYLSPEDRQSFATYESSLQRELEQYLADHARREGFALLTEPAVTFHTDDDLELGQFGIATRMAPGPEQAAEPSAPRAPSTEGPAATEQGATMIYQAAATPPPTPEPPADAAPGKETAWLELLGRRIPLEGRTVIGRSKDAGVHVDDPNASRRHAHVAQEDGAWWVVDLESTNGTEVNGQPAKRARLEDGDRITLGSTELVFRRELS